MTYCAMNGVEVKVPERALRPREPARPLPALTMKSPLVAQRMQRPRTKAERSLVGVDVKECLAIIKNCRAQQRDYELKLKSLVEELAKLVASGGSSAQRKALQLQIDNLIECIKKLAARANEAALAAIKGGASLEDVRAAGLDNLEVRAPVNAAPVIETNSPALLPDGSVIPGPDAKTVDLETGKPTTSEDAALAKVFFDKLVDLVKRGILDEEQGDLQKILAMNKGQMMALVERVEQRGRPGAAEVRAAFKQALAEVAKVSARAASESSGMHPLALIALAGGALWLLSRR